MLSNPLHRNVDRLASPAATWARGESYQPTPPRKDEDTDSIKSDEEGFDGYLAVSPDGTGGYLALSRPDLEHQTHADVNGPDAPVYPGIAGSRVPTVYDEPNADDGKGAAAGYDQPLSEDVDGGGYLVPCQSSNLAPYYSEITGSEAPDAYDEPNDDVKGTAAVYDQPASESADGGGYLAPQSGSSQHGHEYGSPEEYSGAGYKLVNGIYAEPKTPGPDDEYAQIQTLLGVLADSHYEAPIPMSPTRQVVFDGVDGEYLADGGGYANVEADYGELGSADIADYDVAADTTALYDVAASDSTVLYNVASSLETPAYASAETIKQRPASDAPVYAMATFANDGGEPSPTYALAQPSPMYALADGGAYGSRHGAPAEPVFGIYAAANAWEDVNTGSHSSASSVVTYDVASDGKLEPALTLPPSPGEVNRPDSVVYSLAGRGVRPGGVVYPLAVASDGKLEPALTLPLSPSPGRGNRSESVVYSLADAGIYEQMNGVGPIELGPVPTTPSSPFSPGGTLAKRRGSNISSLSLGSPTAFSPTPSLTLGGDDNVFREMSAAGAPESPRRLISFAETPGLQTPRMLPSMMLPSMVATSPSWSPPRHSIQRTTVLLATPGSPSRSKSDAKCTVL